jgi:hypothetical protein
MRMWRVTSFFVRIGWPRLAYGGTLTVAQVALFMACGSRTLLQLDDLPGEEQLDGSPSRPDVPAHPSPDTLPPLDVRPEPDVDRRDCEDAGSTPIYLVTVDSQLLAFEPTTLSFRRIGELACPAPEGSQPFSMAVDRQGTAYVLYSVHADFGVGLYRVSIATGACSRTSYFAPENTDFDLFGMAFATDELGPSETLFVASARDRVSTLGRIDTQTFTLTRLGFIQPEISGAELTGTGDGDIFGFYAEAQGADSYILQIDKESAKVVAQDVLVGLGQGYGWAFAHWGGDFWLFTAPAADLSRVHRFRPSDKSLSQVAEYPMAAIVGAGVSSCVPQ